MMHWELISWSVQMLKKVESMLVRNSWKNWDALAGKRGSGEEKQTSYNYLNGYSKQKNLSYVFPEE